jgi:hypothetical protein
MGAAPQQGSIASETRSLAHPAATNVTGCRLKITFPHAQAGPAVGSPQVSDGFSRSGERIGYDAQSLPPV